MLRPFSYVGPRVTEPPKGKPRRFDPAGLPEGSNPKV